MKTEGNKFISSLLFFLLVTGITITMRLAEFDAPLDRDGGVFAYIGASVLAGDLPSVHNELIPSLESELPHHQDDALYAQDD